MRLILRFYFVGSVHIKFTEWNGDGDGIRIYIWNMRHISPPSLFVLVFCFALGEMRSSCMHCHRPASHSCHAMTHPSTTTFFHSFSAHKKLKSVRHGGSLYNHIIQCTFKLDKQFKEIYTAYSSPKKLTGNRTKAVNRSP